MRNFGLSLIMLMICSTISLRVEASGKNLSHEFVKINNQQLELTASEVKALRQYDIYFIPGILAESLIGSDRRSKLDISLITRDYFETSINVLQKKYKLNAKRLTTSSSNVNETQANIRKALDESARRGKKALLLSHSLGGLALIEELLVNPKIQSNIAGIVFLQSPFYGTGLSEVLLDPPFELSKVIEPILPLLNISQETVDYVGIKSRKTFMARHHSKIAKLVSKVPLYTFSSIVESNKSIFKPTIDILQSGCIKNTKNKCITEIFYQGPYDKSDGLIPLRSSFIPGADYVVLNNVDHGEIILNVPFTDYKKEHMTTSWLRLLLKKINK